MHACVLSLFSGESCPTLHDPMWTPPGSYVHGISQATILEWVAIPSSRGFSRDQTQSLLSLLHCRKILYHRATGEAHFNKNELPQSTVNKIDNT